MNEIPKNNETKWLFFINSNHQSIFISYFSQAKNGNNFAQIGNLIFLIRLQRSEPWLVFLQIPIRYVYAVRCTLYPSIPISYNYIIDRHTQYYKL